MPEVTFGTGHAGDPRGRITESHERAAQVRPANTAADSLSGPAPSTASAYIGSRARLQNQNLFNLIRRLETVRDGLLPSADAPVDPDLLEMLPQTGEGPRLSMIMSEQETAEVLLNRLARVTYQLENV